MEELKGSRKPGWETLDQGMSYVNNIYFECVMKLKYYVKLKSNTELIMLNVELPPHKDLATKQNDKTKNG